jgi:hypothetical protein
MAQDTFATILIGDSHYAAIATAAQETLAFDPEHRGCDLIFFDAWKHALRYPFTVEENGQTVLNPHMTQSVRMIAHNYDAVEVVTVLGGGHHLALTLLDNDHPMDVILPQRPDLPLRDEAMLVSVDFAKNIFLQLIATSFEALACFSAEFPDIPLSQLECPPANGDNAFVRAHLGSYFEANFAPEQLDAISTPAQRFKFWTLQSQMYADKCAALGIDYVRVPESAISANGFLKPEHFGADSTHANAAYGRAILDAIEARLGRKFMAWNSFG